MASQLPQHTLILMPSGRRGQIQAEETILDAAQGMGVSIESICGGKGTCGKCQILIEEGQYQKYGIHSDPSTLNPLTDQENELLPTNREANRRLACACKIGGDLLVNIPEESRSQKQIIRKSANQLTIDVDPAIRQVYLELSPPGLDDHQGHWERIQVALKKDWDLELPEIDLYALQQLGSAIQQGDHKITATIWKESALLDVQPGYQENSLGLAVDLGSTTLAAYLSDLRTGELVSTASIMNPQVPYGEDLMSRISYCTTNQAGLQKLRELIIKAINFLAATAARQAGRRARDILDITLVGNTTMVHILLGISPHSLGQAPFTLATSDPLDLQAAELGIKLHPAARAHILPAQAGHVGGDNVAVLIAEQPYHEQETILIVDVGTNAEIVLSTGNRLYSASSPTGPAFEGGQISAGMRAAPGAIERVRIDPDSKEPRFQVIGEENWSDRWQLGQDVALENQPQHLASGICGSGIIEAVAELFKTGLITPAGQFNPALDSSRLVWDEPKRVGAYLLAKPEETSMGKPLLITQEDIRAIQLAKAALYAGVRLLMDQAGVTQVDQIRLAGAFGSYIDPLHALILGLIPDCDPKRIISVGNAAGDGARLALLNLGLRHESARIAREVEYIETATHPDFQHQFVAAMHLPHQEDRFPHVEDILSQVPDTPTQTRQRRFPRTEKAR
jgi:uncharacterized 2Fe-2S/4Fe-4S cluster protein (DUF4445 family)